MTMWRLIVRVILLVTALLFILLLVFRTRIPFGRTNTSFAVEESAEITRIELAEKGKELILEKNGERWLIDGRDEARKSGILFLLRLLNEIKIKSPVTGQLFSAEITEKGIEPVSVKVYDGRKLIRSFLVYKTHSNIYGNIMKIRQKSKPYIMYVPGFDLDIGSGFTPDKLFWQPFTIFNLLPSEISSVEFENLTDTASSFKISVNNHRFTLTSGSQVLSGWDTALVARYLSYFAWVPFEKWMIDTGREEKSEAESRLPVYRISVKTSEGRDIILTLWERMTSDNGAPSGDSDRLLGRTQASSEFFVIRYFDIDPVIKKKSYFFP